jgi:hypothetical protein
MMKKFDKRVQKNTLVKINENWYAVKSVHETRQWVQVDGLLGSFQVGHIESFKNKATE